MWKRIEPSAGYALFFPKKEGRIIIGQPAFCFLWEEFKHIELGSFKVDLHSDNSFANFELKTADNLPCAVKAVFRIEVKQDIKSLEKATLTCSTSKDIQTKITHDFFKKQIQNTLEDIVKTKVEKITSIDLLKDSQCVQNLQNEIREETKNKVSDMGFKLLGCSTDIELAEPNIKYLARDKNLLEIWNEYLDENDKIEQDLLQRTLGKEEWKTKYENKSKLVRDQEDANYSVERKKLIDQQNKEIRELELAEEENRYITETEKTKIASQQQKLNDDILREKFKYQNDREKQEKSLKLELENFQQEEQYKQNKTKLEQQSELQKLKRTEEDQEQKYKIDSIQYELKLDEFKAQQADLKKKIAETESIQVETLGKAEAEVERLKVLATNAHIIEMNKTLLTLLPDILEKAYGASEKLGEVKIMYLGGGVGDPSGKSQLPIEQPLGTILSSMSTIPMLREVLRFINGWDLTKNHNSE